MFNVRISVQWQWSMFLNEFNNANFFENNAYDESNFRDRNEAVKFLMGIWT